jgi:hypothetical protein
MQTTWAVVPGYNLEASSDGKIRHSTTKRQRGTACRCAGRYPSIIYVSAGKPRQVAVHQLVALAFLGPPPEGQVVHHKDGDPTNNRIENLAYVSRKAHTLEHIEQHRYASVSYRAKLTESQVRELRERREAGELRASLAKAFGITIAQVDRIISRRSWANV